MGTSENPKIQLPFTRSPHTSSAFQSTRSRVLDTKYFLATLIVGLYIVFGAHGHAHPMLWMRYLPAFCRRPKRGELFSAQSDFAFFPAWPSSAADLEGERHHFPFFSQPNMSAARLVRQITLTKGEMSRPISLTCPSTIPWPGIPVNSGFRRKTADWPCGRMQT